MPRGIKWLPLYRYLCTCIVADHRDVKAPYIHMYDDRFYSIHTYGVRSTCPGQSFEHRIRCGTFVPRFRQTFTTCSVLSCQRQQVVLEVFVLVSWQHLHRLKCRSTLFPPSEAMDLSKKWPNSKGRSSMPPMSRRCEVRPAASMPNLRNSGNGGEMIL
jgi:hypothetical protein